MKFELQTNDPARALKVAKEAVADCTKYKPNWLIRNALKAAGMSVPQPSAHAEMTDNKIYFELHAAGEHGHMINSIKGALETELRKFDKNAVVVVIE